MAVIYLQNPSSGEKALILDPRESMAQSFYLGDAWTEVRAGMFYSITSVSGSNTTYPQETMPFVSGGDGMYIGLINSGRFIPFVSGAEFIGIATSTTLGLGAANLSNGLINGYSNQLHVVFASGSGATSPFSINGIYPTPWPASTGLDQYASFLGLKLVITGGGTNGQSAKLGISYSTSGVGTNDISITALRSAMTGLANYTESPYGYYTTGFINGGGALPLPNSFFAYFPFLNSRLRIHSLLIERYEPLT